MFTTIILQGSLNTLLTLDANKSYYIANSTGEIKEAGLWQRFKCWTGLGDGRAKVEKLVKFAEIAIMESVSEIKDEALTKDLEALNKNRSISGAALREIAARF